MIEELKKIEELKAELKSINKIMAVNKLKLIQEWIIDGSLTIFDYDNNILYSEDDTINASLNGDAIQLSVNIKE